MTTMYETFMVLLNAAVDRAGSGNKFAKASGIRQNTISRWVSGGRVPGFDTAQPVLDFLGLEIRFTPPSAPTEDMETLLKGFDRQGIPLPKSSVRPTPKPAPRPAARQMAKAEDLLAEIESKDKTIRELQQALAEARGEVRALERQLVRVLPTTPTVAMAMTPDELDTKKVV